MTFGGAKVGRPKLQFTFTRALLSSISTNESDHVAKYSSSGQCATEIDMESTTPIIRAIFFTRFHPEKGAQISELLADTKLTAHTGRRVLHQVPEGSIVPPSDPIANLPEPLFDFRSVSNFLIPSQEFCDRLVTVCVNHYRIIGYPVCIEDDGRYDRNEFIFNFALVLDEDADMSAHTSVVRKLARMFRNLEEQSGFLSNEEDEDLWDAMSDDDDGEQDDIDSPQRKGLGLGTFPEHNNGRRLSLTRTEKGQKVYALCEMILEDLNNYCECMIPIGKSAFKLLPAPRTSMNFMLNIHPRRSQHDKPQTLSRKTPSSSCTVLACSSSHHPTVSSLPLQYVRPDPYTNPAVHQWHPLSCPDRTLGRRRSFARKKSRSASALLWLCSASRHLSVLSCIRPNTGDQRFCRRRRGAGRSSWIRERRPVPTSHSDR